MVCTGVACTGSKKVTPSQNQSPEVPVLQPGNVIEPETKLNVKSQEEIARDSLLEIHKNELKRTYGGKANSITTYYILAQQNFFNGNYEEALYLVNKASLVSETADVLALKGSIYLGLGSVDNFVLNWRKALELDENLPLPNSPAIIQELQKQGLIDINLERNF